MSDHLENSEFLCCTHFQLQQVIIFPSSSSFEIRHSNDPNTPRGVQYFILYIKWNFVRGSFVRSLVSALSFCTVLLHSSVVYVLQIRKRTTGTKRVTRHGHYTGLSSTGTSRPRTKGHGAPRSALRTKLTATEPYIARAPKLVLLTAIIMRIKFYSSAKLTQ